MTLPSTKHLTADELDAFHTESLNRVVQLHLETCGECRQLVAADRRVVTELNRLPALNPRDRFADRVMSRVTIPGRTPVPVLSFPKLTRQRIASLAALAAGIVISVGWSAANRALLDGWLTGLESRLWENGWSAFQAVSSSVATQTWFESVRQVADSPSRLAAVVMATATLYGSGLFALRRLMTPSSASVSNAGV